MAAGAPDLAEIEATVERMEARYRHAELFVAYKRVRRRFEADLGASLID